MEKQQKQIAAHGQGSGGTISNREMEQSSRELFLDFLAEKGLKLTRQREAVINEIFNDTGHFEAEEIVHRLKKKKGRVSRATVYRTLELLRESQLVEKLDIGNTGALYEHVTAGEHHDHLICTGCNEVIEFHDPALEEKQQVICSRYDFQETHHSLRIFGLCARCRASLGK